MQAIGARQEFDGGIGWTSGYKQIAFAGTS